MSTVEDRFWAKVAAHDADGCWEWLAAKNIRGYSRFSYGPAGGMTHVYGHRFAYELLVGAIPDDLTVDHLCLNKGCVNPAHMELVTGSENTRRRWRTVPDSRRFRTHCRAGHAWSEHGYIAPGDGRRRCRACIRARAATTQAA